MDTAAGIRGGDLPERVLATFVAAHLWVDDVLARSRPRLYHVLEEQGRYELNVLAELGDRGHVEVEVKASPAPRESDARHLAWLRERMGKRFIAGVVLHIGPRVYSLGERLLAAPSRVFGVEGGRRVPW